MSLASALLAFLPFVLCTVTGLCVAAFLARDADDDAPRLYAVLAGMAPAAFFAFVALLLWFLPGLPRNFYVATPLALTGLLLAFLLAHDRKLLGRLRSDFHLPLLAVLTLGVAGTVCLAAIVSPVVENDPLEYIQAGWTIAERLDLRAYPVIAPERGFQGPWTHGPIFPTIYAWDALVGRSPRTPLAGVFAGSFFFLANALLLASLFWGRSWRSFRGVVAAPLVLLGIPVYAYLSMSGHIDALRTFLVAASLISLGESCRRGGLGRGLVAALTLALALHAHSASVLVLPAVAVTCVVAVWRRWPSARVGVMAAMFGFLAWVPWALRNRALFGSPISDMGPGSLFHLPNLHFFEVLRLSRGIDTLWERIVFGALMPWTHFWTFGIVPWLALFALVYGPSRRAIWERCGRDPGFAGLVLAPVSYLGGALLSAPLGIDLFIQNARYPLTFVTGWGVLATTWITSLAITEPSPSRRNTRARWAVTAVVLLASFYSLYQVRRTARVRMALVASPEGEDDAFPTRKAIRAAERHLEAGSSVLCFRQSDWGAFGRKPFIAHHHPRLRPVYEAKTAEEAENALRTLGIGAIATPVYYAEPFFDESALFDLAADPSRVEPVSTDESFGVFVLRKRTVQSKLLPVALEGSGTLKFRRGRLVRTILGVGAPRHDIDASRRKVSLSMPPSLAPREFVQSYVDDVAHWVPGKPGSREVELSVTVRGQGLGAVTLIEDTGNPDAGLREHPLWKGLLRGEDRRIAALRLLGPDVQQFYLRYELHGAGSMTATGATASTISAREVTTVPSRHSASRDDGVGAPTFGD